VVKEITSYRVLYNVFKRIVNNLNLGAAEKKARGLNLIAQKYQMELQQKPMHVQMALPIEKHSRMVALTKEQFEPNMKENAKNRPVTKVITLLKDMQKQLEKEGEEDEEVLARPGTLLAAPGDVQRRG